MSGLMPAYILREWSNDGKLLNGGKIYLYESGTLTPKAAYSDAAMTTPISNPIILDTGGAADIFLGDGAYRVLIKDSTGSQVRPPIDGVVGSGGATGIGGDVSAYSVNVYNDLRALTDSPDVVYVAGRSALGDGGEGWFQRVPGSSLTDDDGSILVNTEASVYRRMADGDLDPRWYGVVYGSGSDQVPSMNNTLAASVSLNRRAAVTGTTTLLQDMTVPAYADLYHTIDGVFVAGASAITVTFASFSRFSSDGIAFGTNIVPKFNPSVCDSIRLSWMGGAAQEDMISKLAGSLASGFTGAQKMLIDRSVTVSTIPAFAAPRIVDWSDGAKITVSAAVAVSFDEIAYQGIDQIVSYSGGSGTVKIGVNPARPEWFGAVADGTTDDSLAFLAAAKTGAIQLRDGKTYYLGALWSTTPTPLSIKGGVVSLANAKTLGTGSLALESTKIANVSGPWFAGTALAIVNSEYPPAYTATAKSIVGGLITGDANTPVFDGRPKIYNGYLDLISAQAVGTDSAGKIVDAKSNYPHGAQLLGTDANGVIIDRGQSPVLDLLQFSKMFFTDWSVTAISGTVTLTNSLKFIYMVDNISAGANITLPTPGAGHSTIVVFFPLRRTNTVTINGTFPSIGTSSISTTTAVFLYYDRASSGWYFLHSDT